VAFFKTLLDGHNTRVEELADEIIGSGAKKIVSVTNFFLCFKAESPKRFLFEGLT
jgi:hypothetical protein